MRPVHSGQLERWLGPQVHDVSRSMSGWYGSPIAMAGIPGNVWAMPDGDFAGVLRSGYEASGLDRAMEWLGRVRRAYWRIGRDRSTLRTGFASYAELIGNARAWKRQHVSFQKTISIGGATTYDTFFTNNFTAPGVATTPGTEVAFDSTSGGIPFRNAPSGQGNYITNTWFTSNTGVAITHLLIDRLSSYGLVASDTSQVNAAGANTRYTSTTPGDPDFAGNSFAFPVLTANNDAVTAYNWTVCTYTAQDGSGGRTMPSIAALANAVAGQVCLAAGQWFIPLQAGDYGIKHMETYQISAANTDAQEFVLAHPLCWMVSPLVGFMMQVDGITSAFNMVRVFDEACLSTLVVPQSSGTQSGTYQGEIVMVQG